MAERPREQPGPAPRPVEQRFWASVDRRGPAECWPWLGHVSATGYPRFRLKLAGVWRDEYAYRVALALATGEAPAGDVRAACGNRRCVNPAHLESVPVSESRRRNAWRFWHDEG